MSTIKLRRGTAATWASQNPTLQQGEPGFETDTGILKMGDGSTAWNSLPPVFESPVSAVVKPSDETRTSSPTYADDSHLAIAVAGNTVYELFLFMRTNSDAAEDLDFRLVGPSGCTAEYTYLATQAGVPVALDADQFVGGSGTLRVGIFRGVVVTGGTAGTLKVQWKQRTSGANGSSVLANSFLRLIRVGVSS